MLIDECLQSKTHTGKCFPNNKPDSFFKTLHNKMCYI